ncbi:MAG TPA: glycosyltransferase family 39 protein [Candidatus Methylomirabilis sp.]|nr:glycosyltransferase family 39 protein [Candidatus Methylomirabilis sp.]
MGVSMFFRKIGTAVKKSPPKRAPMETPSPRQAALEQFIVEEIEIGDVKSPAAAVPLRVRKRSAWWVSIKAAAACTGLWLLLIMASLFARSVWPVDETRMLTVAWEMWTRSEFVLPSLNGELYARQPPLIAWLIDAGWVVFGVNDWWPRVLPALFSLASLAVVHRLARLLWRENGEIGRLAPLVLLGTPLWALYTTLALPDMLFVFFTLLGWWAVLIMWRHRDMRAFLLLGAALGFGALALGTIICVYVLPATGLAPLWVRDGSRVNWKYWYIDIAKAILLGAAILGLWLVPAGMQAGSPYVMEWLSGSLIGARLDLFTTGRSWWWYLAWMPIVCLPWSMLPLLWWRLWHIRREPLSVGMAFCVIGTMSTLVLLSLIEVKQPPFLLPLLPLMALPVSYLLMDESLEGVGDNHPLGGMTVPVVMLGGALAVLPKLPRVEVLPGFLWDLSPFVGIGVMVVGIALAWLPAREVRRRVVDTVVTAVLLVVFLILGAGSQFDEFYRTDTVGQFLANAQAQNRAIAYVGEYQGEFQFAGRLREPLPVIDPADADSWRMNHPDGLLVSDASVWQPRQANRRQPAMETLYRGSTLRVWDANIASAPR